MSTHRFKPGDVILILPKFAHLYPSDSGIVTRVEPDLYRQMFNEYTIQFPDGSTECLFEFQILESGLNFQTLIAAPVFDSRLQPSPSQTRGSRTVRQIILRATPFDIDMAIQVSESRASIIGQILERHTTQLIKSAEIRLLKESTPLTKATSDNSGVFKFTAVPLGPTNILVLLPQNSIRILGTFSL